jgi:type IV pilus assembly protein PilC
MPSYTYTALNEANKTLEGSIEAPDELTAISTIQARNLRVVRVAKADSAKKNGGSLSFLQSNRVKSDDLVMFTRQLSAMVGAGVPLLRALSSLEEHTDSAGLKKVSGAVYRDVQSGLSLGEALGKHPRTFNSIYVNMVRAGEAAGILDDILKRLAMQQEKSASIRKKVKSAMTYPTVLVVITVLAFFGLMIFVIPQIGDIVKDLGGEDAELPLLTLIMLSISDFMIAWWYILVPLFVGAIIGLLRYIKTDAGRRLFHRLILKIPGVKTIIIKVAVARFARVFSALMGAGVAVLEALEVTAHAVGNTVFEDILLGAIDAVKNGSTLSSVINQSELFPPIVGQMLAVGEETGQTETVLVKVADFYEEEVDVAIDGMSSIIEPIMIVLMGSMVGLIAASVMLPIANMSNTIQ